MFTEPTAPNLSTTTENTMLDAPTAPTLPAKNDAAETQVVMDAQALADRETIKQERIAKLKELRSKYFGYPEADDIMLGIDGLLDLGAIVTKRNTPARCITVIGDSGSGKTSVLLQKQSKHKPRDVTYDGVTTKTYPFIYVEVPVKCSLKGLSEALLLAMGEPERNAIRGTDRALAKRAAGRMASLGVQVVILDEFQHLVSRGNRKVNYDVVDYVKGQLNNGHTSFVLSGTHESMRILAENDQLEQRSAGHFELTPVSEDDPKAFRNLKGMLARYVMMAPVPFAFELDDAFARRVLRMAYGHRGRALDFMHALQSRAIMKYCPSITHELVVETALLKRSLSDPDWRNPFDQKKVEAKVPVTDKKDLSEPTGLSVRERGVSVDDLLHPHP
jgi:hypothetical protein